MCNVFFFSYACILIGHGLICRYIFMAMYIFVLPFHEATFCGVPSCVFDKSGCAACEKRFRNTAIEENPEMLVRIRWMLLVEVPQV
jgi:hypothetical protein